MEDRKITEQESLEIITSMIARTQRRYLGNGNILLMWGYLIVAVSILIWALLSATRNPAWNWLWFAIPVIGYPATALMSRKKRIEAGALTYSDTITSRLWAIFGLTVIVLSLICLGFALIGERPCWIALLIYTLIAAPFAQIAQGLVVREKSLTIGGIIGLLIGMIAGCCAAAGPLSASWFMPMFITAWIATMIVPGHILNHKTLRK